MAIEDLILNCAYRSRQAGSTQALVDGLKAYRGELPPLVIAHSTTYADELYRRFAESGVAARILPIHAPSERVLGSELGPVVLDLPAAQVLAEACALQRDAAATAQRELGIAQRELGIARAEVERLREDRAVLREQVTGLEFRLKDANQMLDQARVAVRGALKGVPEYEEYIGYWWHGAEIAIEHLRAELAAC